MERSKFVFEGKSKKVYSTENKDQIIIHYKDEVTAYNGIKKANINNKGILTNKITAIVFEELHKNGIPTHYIKRLNDREQLCRKVNVIPLEMIVRNVCAGSLSKRLNIKEGTPLNNTIYEISYKNKILGEIFINDHHAVALGVVTYEELNYIYDLTKKINECLKKFFKEHDLIFVDFKIEFGKTETGDIILADDISPDSARMWDINTNEKLDKDRFRRDMGSFEEAYIEILTRLEK